MEAGGQDKKVKKIKKRLLGVIEVCLLFVVVGTIGGWFARFSSTAELFTHFKVLYFLGSCFALLYFALARRWRWAALAATLAIWHVVGIIPWYVPNRIQTPESVKHLRLVSANVNSYNTQYDLFLEWVNKVDPDVLLIQEISPGWDRALRVLEQEYPYFLSVPRSDNFGIATYSRVPLEGLSQRDSERVGVPTIRTVINVNSQQVRLLNYHTIPPGPGWMSETRNDQLAYLSEYVREENVPAIVMGDLNVTMWSPYYRDLEEDSGLINARRGRGVMPTWSGVLPFPLILPLDHALLSPEIGVVHFAIGPHIGSDHRPIVLDICLPETTMD